jgi:tRNA (cytidine32/uridine32-2'-O)-methyltransferase
MITFVLVETSLPRNIGTAIRAMVTMGITNLILVNPKQYPHDDIQTLASHAYDLINIKVLKSLPDALANFDLIIGTSARHRNFGIQTKSMDELFDEVKNRNVAILFGPERTGLTNEDMLMCNFHMYIDANPNYPVLNLAQATQIVAYKFNKVQAKINDTSKNDFVNFKDKSYLFNELNSYNLSKSALDKLVGVFTRLNINKSELDLLIGVLKKRFHK